MSALLAHIGSMSSSGSKQEQHMAPTATIARRILVLDRYDEMNNAIHIIIPGTEQGSEHNSPTATDPLLITTHDDDDVAR